MRISTRPDDPGYGAYLRGSGAEVFLDGVEIGRCLTADDQLGLVVVYKVHPDGSLCIDRKTNEVLTETLYGKVKIQQR